jgi:hypothetical protein
MRNGILAALVVGLTAWRVSAQAEPRAPGAQVLPTLSPSPSVMLVGYEPGYAKGAEVLPAPSAGGPIAPPTVCTATDFNCDTCGRRGGLYGSADYLLWWIRSGPVNTPLMANGDPTDKVPGALDQPGTQVTVANSLNYGTFSGLRFGLGYQFQSGLAVEAGYFLLEQRAFNFFQASDPNGLPMFGRPFFDTFNNLENNLNTAFPNPAAGGFAGNSTITSHTRLQGWELNLAHDLGCQNCNRRFTLLAGFRYLDLNEDLLFEDTILPPGTGNITFGGLPVNPAATITDFDRFHAVNHFYGGQIGARMEWLLDRFTVGVVAKVALGVTGQQVTIDGASNMITPAGTATLPGGLLAEPSNIGSYYRNVFGVVPEAQLNFGWRVTDYLTLKVGYTFIYWNSVARPGEQIDRNVNGSIVPTHQSFGLGNNNGPPFFNFHSSDFWAQGLTFGLEYRY